MPAVELVRQYGTDQYSAERENPLPQLLHTPLGQAIIEIQGTIHASFSLSDEGDKDGARSLQTVHVGRLEFPLYNGGDAEGPWMKKVYLYIGKHQRLTGEIKRLPKPLLVLLKEGIGRTPATASTEDQLTIHAIIKHKILFSSRPEPVGG